MEIESTTFGTITIDGKTYEHDVVIRLSGDVVKRKKKLSKKYYGTSHMLSKDERRIGLLRPNGESGRLSLRLFLNPINRLTLQSRRLGDFGNGDALAQKPLDGGKGRPIEAWLPASEFRPVIVFLSVEDASPLRLFGCLGLCLGSSRHEGNQSVTHGLLHGVLGCAIKHHAVDDRADDNTSPHKFANGVGYVAVVSAKPIHPTNDQGIARPEQIKQPPPLGPIRERGADAGHPVVGHYLIYAVTCGLGLRPLVGERLFGGAHPGVENGSPRALLVVRMGSVLWELIHNGLTHPRGLDFGHFFEVHKPIPLRTIRN